MNARVSVFLCTNAVVVFYLFLKPLPEPLHALVCCTLDERTTRILYLLHIYAGHGRRFALGCTERFFHPALRGRCAIMERPKNAEGNDVQRLT